MYGMVTWDPSPLCPSQMVSTEKRCAQGSHSAGGSPSPLLSYQTVHRTVGSHSLQQVGNNSTFVGWWEENWRYCSVWVGLRYTLVEREPSSLCNIVTSKNGITCPLSEVNWMFWLKDLMWAQHSINLVCWYRRKDIIHISLPKYCRLVPTVFWKRYVMSLQRYQQTRLMECQAHINSINQNIQFASEREQGHVIPFLDCTMTMALSTNVYRKPTHTDQYLQFSSHHPTNGLVREGDPPALPLSSVLAIQEGQRGEGSRVTILYTQGVSEAVTRILSDINVQVHMKPFRTLRRILSHPKDRIPDDDKSSVVYKINCRDCDASYVGETGRALKTRVSEHRRAMEKRDFSASARSSAACMEA